VLLNVVSGDHGVLETRHCGCKFEELGLREHIYNIRGFDRLSSEGMTFVGTDLVRILEEVLPAEFGGNTTDYQIVEEEDNQGYTHTNIIVSPKFGKIDDDRLINIFLSELGKGKDAQRMMAAIWSKTKTLQIKREMPFTRASGKLLPLHIREKHNR